MTRPDAQFEATLKSIEDIDALLLLSFGGPEGVDEVRPFLENVTAGRGIPPERLDEVGKHYYHFGGKSPLNDLNKEIIANIEAELASRGIDLPVFFGNRNWKPFANDTASEMAKAGVRTAAVFATSAWGGYSGCRQYGEDIQAMREHLQSQGLPLIDFLKIRQFFDHPMFIEEQVSVIEDAFRHWGLSPKEAQDQGVRLVFSAHSIPVIANERAGTPEDGSLYSLQIEQASKLVAEKLGFENYDVVWQSASGNGRVPWLEPDIVDHAEQLEAQGVEKMVVAAIGFISDHMEVVWDLDNELQTAIAPTNLEVVRAATVGHTDTFASMVVDLIEESIGSKKPQHLGSVPSKGCTINGAPCEVSCCEPMKRGRAQ
ncbi:ferrochelatase [Corynebacterium gerontici]|uniref:Coproporphyrin III ferrochelatase n=1 Tax=Corynebacterium gerontici TaxID=2079234 RepID=A0A3G6J4W6_9CORY|nr:ferrochelatase [Corynebacterium gerontici]AZA11450.1 Ferrochelatase [Corynebacterium gerontici]